MPCRYCVPSRVTKHRGNNFMASSLDTLIASWQERRTFLSQQLERLRRGDFGHSEVRAVLERQEIDLIQQDIQRIESWIADLDALLTQHNRL
jgi:hypothetical protein